MGRERRDVAGVPLLGVSHRMRMEGEREGDGREIRPGFRIFGRNRVVCVLVGMCAMCVQGLRVLLTVQTLDPGSRGQNSSATF